MDSSDRLFNHSYACHHNDDVKRFEAHPLGPSLLADRRVPDFYKNCWYRGRPPFLLSKVRIQISLPGHSSTGWSAGSAAVVLNGNTIQVYFSFTKLSGPSRHRSAVHSVMNHNHWWNSSRMVAEKQEMFPSGWTSTNVEAANSAAGKSLLKLPWQPTMRGLKGPLDLGSISWRNQIIEIAACAERMLEVFQSNIQQH